MLLERRGLDCVDDKILRHLTDALAQSSLYVVHYFATSPVTRRSKSSETSKEMVAENHVIEDIEFQYEGNNGRSINSNEVTYSWRDINVFAPTAKNILGRAKKDATEKQILKGVSGVCQPGCLLAIIGASGAGKTTLLNVLNGRNRGKLVITGQLMVNNLPLTQDFLSRHSAYVQQEDLFIGTLTVREQLVFQATLRMDQDIPYEKRMKRVDEVLIELGLAKCSDAVIGIPGRIKGISGGERKRLAFASEVLSNPMLMFCDEPTSCLDSFMALNVMSLLKNMAKRGKSIITTIHQPSSEVFAMFDQVLLMSEGRVAFLGTTEEALNLFKSLNTPCPRNFNPADFFIMKLAIQPEEEEECRNFCNLVCDKFESSERYKSIIGDTGAPIMNNAADTTGRVKYKASWLVQFSAVYKRSFKEVVRDPLTLKIRAIIAMVISISIGLIFFGQEVNQAGIININGATFLVIINLSIGNIIPVVMTFCSQNIIFLREHFNGAYRTDVYYMSKNLAHLPGVTVITIIYAAIVYFMVGFNSNAMAIIDAIMLLVLIVNTAVSYGYLISCLVANPNTASVITAPLVVPLLIFGGLFLKSDTVPVYFSWLKYLSWFNHANEALMINQWGSIEEIHCSANAITCIGSGKEVLRYLGYEENNFWYAVGNLVILLLSYRILAFLALLKRAHIRK